MDLVDHTLTRITRLLEARQEPARAVLAGAPVDISTIRRWRSGETTPTIRALRKLTAWLDAQEAALSGRSDVA